MSEPPIRSKPIALEKREDDQGRLFSPSAGRNRDVVRDVLVAHMPSTGTIFEVGAGTGEHAVHFASALPEVDWYPGDPDAASRKSIAAWMTHTELTNIRAPHQVDVSGSDWADLAPASLAGIVSLNMIHISPFEAAKGLIAGAGKYLQSQGRLFLYGPFSRNGVHTAPSNEQFDANLKARDERWGVRDLDHDIVPVAQSADLNLETIIEMPANNLSVVFSKV